MTDRGVLLLKCEINNKCTKLQGQNELSAVRVQNEEGVNLYTLSGRQFVLKASKSSYLCILLQRF